ncbi:hypothetical protein AAA799E16_01437 [Marine Group I thaumarchaeote SCGC AAA799-E16]|uniref:Uncharacterized protein n=4 Tax=Marine Group I TaxID=905826 RepID=A0A081RNT1_9ARCH|nr:hypothetical protein AAA799N04_00688 [Marine Group I thaumarchaeote SCGC AAA799-N04]KER05871.1 hypothetical protein AAA799E16_01437 [Marine Group I thaumarchaeote SCGC AAA799-E16]KFM16256.1 hypothetical protein AAA799D11_00739 [Marine Group I thaumarchaeote SCGC AAA799-D11]KFM16465.1 hypothetical protein SCCGRSA3_02249 [Marine Group I thaumarchaeote SCGC RSA3]
MYQISEDYTKGGFASKQKRLFELGLIDKTHNQELKILNEVRNLIAHNLYPNDQILEAVKKFPTYDQVKMPPELEYLGAGASEMGKFGLISFILLLYLFLFFGIQKQIIKRYLSKYKVLRLVRKYCPKFFINCWFARQILFSKYGFDVRDFN